MAAFKLALLLVVSAFFSFKSCNAEEDCGRIGKSAGYVMYAKETTRVWPWHVAIYNSSGVNIAGGTIISNRFILTAAHVTFRTSFDNTPTKLNPHELYVVAGIKNLKSPQNYTQYRNVSRIIRYPQYSTDTLLNDVALLELSKNITFTVYVSPICLWPVEGPSWKTLTDEYKGIVVGWGLTENSTVSEVLREASLNIIDFDACAQNTKSFQPLLTKGRNYCAGTRGAATVCKGDSGGGMYFFVNFKWYIRGIVNQGTPTQDTRYPCDPYKEVIFMDVSFYNNWIERHAMPTRHNRLGLKECGMREYDGVLKPGDLTSPWTAHLYYRYWNRFNVSDCHGVVIHPEFVVAPARCIAEQQNRTLLYVVLGDETIGPDPYEEFQGNTVHARFRKTIVHQNFTKEKLGYDVGLIQLETPIDFNDNKVKIRPICLPTTYEPVPFYEQTAWMRRKNHPKFFSFSKLQEVNLESCKVRYNSSGLEDGFDQLMCMQDCSFAKDVNADGTYTCLVSLEKSFCDVPLSGGPIFYAKNDGINKFTYLAGMRVFGTDNCTDRLNDVYSNMTEMGSWIVDQVKANARFDRSAFNATT